MPDVLFIDLPTDFNHPVQTWSLGFRYMISSLRGSGFSGELLHAPATDPRRSLINQIVRKAPNVLGLSTCDEYLSTVLKFIKDLRAAGCAAHITLGCLCASAIPDIILNGVGEVDSVVVGEG